MFCQKCGNQIPDGSMCCNFCGAPQQAKSSGFENGSQPAQQINPPVVPPVAPPPAPKKNNTLLIVIIAILAVVTVLAAIVIAKPDIFDSGSSSSSQSEEKDDKKKDDEDESESEKETVTQKEDVPTDAENAEAALDYYLNCLYDPYSDETIDLLSDGRGFPTQTEESIYNFYCDILNYYDYEITGYEEDGDIMVFTVDIETIDFYSIVDDLQALTAEIAKDPELTEEVLSYDDVTRGYYMLSLIFSDVSVDVETTTVTVDVEMVCKGNGDWEIADNGASIVLGILNNFNDAMFAYAESYQ